MLVGKVVQFAALAAAVLWESTTDAASSTTVKFCGRQLGEIMSRVCHAYNSPSWDVPTVVEQPGATVRRRRQLGGIADECCIIGCTWQQLSEYCSISAYSESPLEELEAHIIADRSAEQEGNVGAGAKSGTGASASARAAGAAGAARAAAAAAPAAVGSAGYTGVAGARREVGSARSRGYGRPRARARRCWCRRKRRSGRRRSSLMGNMGLVKNAARAAPVVGTVSPLITWGRTLNTDLPPAERDRYAYVVSK